MDFQRVQDLKPINARIAELKTHEGSVRIIVNETLPTVVSGIWGGDNVSTINDMLRALNSDRRRSLGRLLSQWMPNEYNKDKCMFGKKFKDDKVLAGKKSKYIAFLESGRTVFGELDLQSQRDASNAEPDYQALLERAIKKAVNKGKLDIKTILHIVRECAPAAEGDQPEEQAKVA